jgi:3-oxoacyl-[acyl-carrier protein] reductase
MSSELFDLSGRVATVTGASRGLGRHMALALAQAGADLVITSRDTTHLTAAESEIKAAGRQVLSVPLDVRSLESIQQMVAAAEKFYGHLDILVNNAGSGVFKKLVDIDRADFDTVFATNVTGAMLMGREAAKHFIQQNRGNIINVSSTAGLRGAANGTAYYASKFALRGMTECWRAELRQYNIRVFLLNPSEVLTDFAATAGYEQKDNPTKLRGEDIAHMVKAMLEMDDRGFTPELTIFATNPKD